MKIIAVTSGKGGVGKSCVAAYAGIALANRGRKTLLMELGNDPRSLDVILGVSETSLFTSNDVINGVCDFKQAVAQTGMNENLHLVPCSPDSLEPCADGDDFIKLQKNLKVDFDYDYVIVDGVDFGKVPPHLLDMIIIVLSPETMSVRASAMMAKSLYLADAKDIRLVINDVPSQILPILGVNDFDDIIDMTGARLLGVVPSSPKLKYASNNTTALANDSLTPRVFECIAGRIEGENHPLLVR